MRGRVLSVGYLAPGEGRCRRIQRARRQHKPGMVTGVLDERQTGYILADRWGTPSRTMRARRAAPAGRVPPFVRSGGLRPWTRFAALALLFTAALLASSVARADDPASLRARPSGCARRAPVSQPRLTRPSSSSTRSRPGSPRAEARLAALRSKQERLEDEEASARRHLTIARSTLREAERAAREAAPDALRRGRGRPAGRPARRRVPRRGADGARRARPRSRPGRFDPRPGAAMREASSGVPCRRSRSARPRSRSSSTRRAAERSALAGARAERAGYLAELEQQQALTDAAIARLTRPGRCRRAQGRRRKLGRRDADTRLGARSRPRPARPPPGRA